MQLFPKAEQFVCTAAFIHSFSVVGQLLTNLAVYSGIEQMLIPVVYHKERKQK